MPIRPENRARYPLRWKSEIRPRILERAGHCCEGSPDFPDCRAPDHSIGFWENRSWVHITTGDAQLLAETQFSYGDLAHLIRIVLTVAHLDHVPEHCDDDNLRAWCQRCHLHYDRHHHAGTSNATRRAPKAAGDLFYESTPSCPDGADALRLMFVKKEPIMPAITTSEGMLAFGIALHETIEHAIAAGKVPELSTVDFSVALADFRKIRPIVLGMDSVEAAFNREFTQEKPDGKVRR